MSMWLRRGTAATLASATGILFLAGPAAAAPSVPSPISSAAAPSVPPPISSAAVASSLTPPISSAAAAPTSVDERLFLYNDDGDSPVEPGGTVTFVMTTAGVPEQVPQHRTVVLELPDGLSFAAADNEQAAGPCVPDAEGTTVTCTTGDPVDEPPATNGAWWVRTDVAEDAALGEFLTAKATLSTEIPDPAQENNVSTWQVFVTTGGDMSVAISAPPGPWPVGSTFDARITVHNFGPYRSPATLSTQIVNSVLKITGWPAACQSDPSEMECPLGVIETGATVVINLRIRVSEFGLGYLSLRPEIEPTAPDTDLSNNVATYRADITRPAPGDDDGQGGGGEPTLPITGAPATPLALAGLGLLVAGMGALLLTRRRA